MNVVEKSRADYIDIVKRCLKKIEDMDNELECVGLIRDISAQYKEVVNAQIEADEKARTVSSYHEQYVGEEPNEHSST
jgi:hypothetical protein